MMLSRPFESSKVRVIHLFVGLLLSTAACGGSDIASLEPGDCFDDFGAVSEVATVEILDCAEPHDNELYAEVLFPGDGPYPGDEPIFDHGTEECLKRFDRFVGIAYEESELDVGLLYPSEETWQGGDRQIQCFVYALDGSKVVGSLGSSFR